MADATTLYVGTSSKGEKQFLTLKLANRHGLITGATGTGKTVSLQILAESFSDAGVPVFCSDVKGDLSGISQKGTSKPFLEERAKKIGFEGYEYRDFPVMYWDLFGEQGHPLRATIQEMGPLLLARMMDLNEVQEGILNIAFRVAADEKMPLLDLKDLRAIIGNVAERASELTIKYGNVSKTSVGTIQRRLLVLEDQGADKFFGEPHLDINDFMRTTRDGRGYINVLAADQLMQSPKLYACFLFWMLNELFLQMPEVGDPEKPRLVFFFDEAHLLFDQAPKPLLDQVERVTRLIRSKGVGVYYITQNPLDVPDTVASQLGNRIQHALRAYTPREQKAVKAAATTFRQNPEIDTEKAIMELGVGEALVSMLEGKGAPSIVQRTLIRPPSSRLGPVTPEERAKVIKESPVFGQYERQIDRESAHEMLMKRTAQAAEATASEPASGAGRRSGELERHGEFQLPPAPTAEDRRRIARNSRREDDESDRSSTSSRRQSASEAFTKSVLRSLGSAIGRALGDMFRGRR